MSYTAYLSNATQLYECIKAHCNQKYNKSINPSFMQDPLPRIMKNTWVDNQMFAPRNSKERIAYMVKKALEKLVAHVDNIFKPQVQNRYQNTPQMQPQVQSMYQNTPQMQPRPQSKPILQQRSMEHYIQERNAAVDTSAPDSNQVMQKIHGTDHDADKPMTNEEMTKRLEGIIQNRRSDSKTILDKPADNDTDVKLIPLVEDTIEKPEKPASNIHDLAKKLASKYMNQVQRTAPVLNKPQASMSILNKPQPQDQQSLRKDNRINQLNKSVAELKSQVSTLEAIIKNNNKDLQSKLAQFNKKPQYRTVMRINWSGDDIAVWSRVMPQGLCQFINNKKHINGIVNSLSDKELSSVSVVDMTLDVPCVRNIVNCSNCVLRVLECKGAEAVQVNLPHTEHIDDNYLNVVCQIFKQAVDIPIRWRSRDDGTIEVYFDSPGDQEHFKDTIIYVPPKLFRWASGGGHTLTGQTSYVLDILSDPPSNVEVVFKHSAPRQVRIPMHHVPGGLYTKKNIKHAPSCWIQDNGTVDIIGCSKLNLSNHCNASVIHDFVECKHATLDFMLEICFKNKVA